MDGANWLSPGHHTLRLTCGPAGNRTATGSLSATSRTSPYQLLHRDALQIVFSSSISRSKARSLHEKKLLQKLQHGHRWSHETWQHNNQTTNQTNKKRQDADPPARFASHHPKDSKVNSERGKSPTETTTNEICQGHSGKNPLCRN